MVTDADASKSTPSSSISSPPAVRPARGETSDRRGRGPTPAAERSRNDIARNNGAPPALRNPAPTSNTMSAFAGNNADGLKVSVPPTVSSVPGSGCPLAVTETFAATVAVLICVENTTDRLGTSSGTVSPDCADVETTKKSETGPNESETPEGVTRADTSSPDPTETAVAPPPATP